MSRAPSSGWIGWGLAGRVDRLGREEISTEFFWAIIPVWARARSVYLFRDSDGEERWFEIPRDRRSVALGFLRTPVWFAVAILGAGGVFANHWAALAIAIALAIIGGVLTWSIGALDPLERDRRELLQRVTGLGAPPELLPTEMRERTRDHLAHAWFVNRKTDWRSSILAGVASEALVALAEYDRAPQLLIRARTNLIDAEGN